MNKRKKYYIGIDCGVNTGVAIWNRQERRLVYCATHSILQAMAFISGFAESEKSEVIIRIEDARLRKWIPRQKDETAERGRNRGAGSVMRDAQIWQEYAEQNEIDFEMVAPKNNKTKVTADYFRKVTKWEEQTNSHCRDAAMLVFGF